jgi:hypothetical protein
MPITRHQVTAAIHEMQIIPTISIDHRITGPGAQIGIPNEAVYVSSNVSYTATELAWDPRANAYRCYICSGTFKTLKALDQHFDSPAHDRPEFQCPKKKCRKKFKLISSFIQHIESGACGLTEWTQIAEHTKALTDQFTRLLKA